MASASGNKNAAASSSGAQRRAPPVVQPGGGNNIIINPNQRLNPILEAIKNVGKEFGEIPADFQVGRTTGVLFLSLRYHRLHPEYIHTRVEGIKNAYNLRILLLMCDISEHQDPIRELTKMCIINNITVIVTWSAEEAGSYLATYKRFEHRPPTMIKERIEKEPAAIMRAALTSISKVNKTDVETLRTTFGSFASIAKASADDLAQLPGFGPKKVARMKDAFDRPFRNAGTSTLAQSQSQIQEDEDAMDAANSNVEASRGTIQAPAGQRPLPDIRMPPPPPPPTRKDKGKARATSADFDADELSSPSPPPTLTGVVPRPKRTQPASSSTGQKTRPQAREESPPWDIELDLTTPEPEPPRQTGKRREREREESPVWDIELDLNPSDVEEEEGRGAKRRR
ncbi:unnamed protein product [Peniophora sp. CBMAI 1063]|nr:unnamed protein product [Peniophora sp. CBMAI 1063]